MASHQSPAQKETVERVMHEYKHGELKTARGNRKVESRSQAVAIALHEAGASRSESPKENAGNLRRTKTKERRGETYRDEAEGHHSAGRRSGRKSEGKTRDELYAEARRADIPGRSRMSKAELARALNH
jgi:hypothetical protein